MLVHLFIEIPCAINSKKLPDNAGACAQTRERQASCTYSAESTNTGKNG